ncbi:hypothetical protein GT347_11585 [Xylophilus rhododendri]|uniref:Stress-induced protein n=1 Tax=Xylophilus rhododendri TaxID=2697032 RepID=A0A857J3R8_9BURK|nr:KGG domain-containing protein [Xylophilus rhododendri]QHI98580.1 hypothetical protein GT347_11585 [Xylophilus rhododendri]
MKNHSDDPLQPPKQRRGFASMDPDRLRDISSRGGSAPHRSGKRGFALMDEERRREVSQKGLEARRDRSAAPTLDQMPTLPPSTTAQPGKLETEAP